MKSDENPESTRALTQSFGSTRLFSLPDELFHKIFSYLGTEFRILDDNPTKEQKAKTKALAVCYLIKKTNDANELKYELGFCKKNPWGEKHYIQKPLDPKSSFYRVMTEDPHFLLPKNFMMHYLEQTIQAMGGIIKHTLHEKISVAQTCKTFRELIHVKKELLKQFLLHVAFGEQDEAEVILKLYPELLRSDYTRDVLSYTEHLEFHNVTAFQLALIFKDWHMWNMMLKYIPEDERKEYLKDLQEQKQAVDHGKIWYTLHNLGLCGLRVLEAGLDEPTEAQKQAVKDREAYHLILHRNDKDNIINAELGFYQKNAKAGLYDYVRHELGYCDLKSFFVVPENKPIFQRKKGHSHLILRDKKLLQLAKKVINSQDGETEFKDNKTFNEHLSLLQSYVNQYNNNNNNNLSRPERREFWCVIIGRAQRLCFSSSCFVQYWMSQKSSWWDPRKEVFQSKNRSAAVAAGGFLVFPLPCFFGSAYSYVAGWGLAWDGVGIHGDALAVGGLVKFFYQVVSENYQTLDKILTKGVPRPSGFIK